MMMSNWKNRLEAAIKASGKSQREISIAAGLGPGYVNALFKEDKDATIGHLLSVCRAAEVSIFKVIAGFDIEPQTELFLRLLTQADEETQKSILHLLQSARKSGEAEKPSPASQDQKSTTQG